MSSSRKLYDIGWIVVLSILSPIIVWELVLTLRLAVPSYRSFLWTLAGISVYFLVNRFIHRTPDFIKTFSHELNHAVVCCIFFKKVTTFNVRERSGEIYHIVGGGIITPFISLAPYCFPFLVYVLLMIRVCLASDMVWIFDIIIGFVLAFYIHCFKDDTRRNQTDINRFGNLVFPYWFIHFFRVLNAVVVIKSLLPHTNVFKAFLSMFTDAVMIIKTLLG